jgi:hypothetical protein
MDLTIISPTGKILDFIIEDWEPLVEGNEPEIALILLEHKEAKMLQHTLEYNDIITRMTTDCVIVNKPNTMKSECNEDQEILLLDFRTK